MVVQDGCRALWRGLPPTLWRDVPFSAIYWMGYEKCKASMEQSTLQFNEIEMSFAAGALSGIVSKFTTIGGERSSLTLSYSLQLPLQHHLT